MLGVTCFAAVVVIGTIIGCDKENTGTDGDTLADTDGYVDLGLPSGTKWKASNERKAVINSFYTYNETITAFDNNLPSVAQLMELRNNCEWKWYGKGYKVVGPNGKYIKLPAAGYSDTVGDVYYVGSRGFYWLYTHSGYGLNYGLVFFSDRVDMGTYDPKFGLSVRLVQN